MCIKNQLINKPRTTNFQMTKEELKEILQILREQGMQPQLCDKPIGVSISSACCGMPTEMGDEGIDDYLMLPKAVVGQFPEMLIPVSGESMIDAGFEPGDKMRVCFGMTAHDGDSVLVMIDGACTVKSLFTDDDDTIWLVPQNEAYDAIQLKPENDVRILGVVVGLVKASVRASSRSMLQSIRRTKSRQQNARSLTDEEVNSCIIKIGDMVKHARQWYAVFRMMVDCKVAQEDGIQEFCDRVKMLLPDHGHLPVCKELQRMAVQCFAKPVSLWTPENAPVSGQWFKGYLSIAQAMGRLLGEG